MRTTQSVQWIHSVIGSAIPELGAASMIQRMLPIRGLFEIAIPVQELARAEAFYCGVLGFEIGLRDERRRWIFLRAGAGAAMVVLQEQSGFPRYHFAFSVDERDLEEAASSLRKSGVSTGDPFFHEWIPGKSLYFEDPDGHDLELFAPTG